MSAFKFFSSEKKLSKVEPFNTAQIKLNPTTSPTDVTTSEFFNFNDNNVIEEEDLKNKEHNNDQEDIELIKNKAHFKRLKKKKLSTKEFFSKKKSKINIKPIYQRKPGRKLSVTNTRIFSEFLRKTLIKQQNNQERYRMIIKCLSPDFNIRTKEDINVIKAFIKKNKIAQSITCDRVNNENENEILFKALSHEMEYKYLKINDKLFEISDKPDYIYLIIKGRVELYELVEYRTDMNLFKYMRYIYYLYNNSHKEKSEMNKLKKIIENNKDIIEISIEDIPSFILLLVQYRLNYIINNNSYNSIFSEDIEEIISDCKNDPLINLQNFFYDKKRRYDDMYIKNVINELYKRLPKASPELTNKYKIMLNDNKEEIFYKVKKYNLKKIEELKEGDYLGENTLDSHGHRKYTVISLEETHLAFIDYDIYLDIINIYNEKIRDKEARFLKDSFYFRKISLQYFIKNLFSNFTYLELYYGNNVITQNQSLEYLYFLKDGIIEAYCDKSIIELVELLNSISQKVKNNHEQIKNELYNINNKLSLFGKLNKNFTIKMKSRLLVIINTDIFGIESWINGLPHIYNCRVISERAKFYKIPLDKISMLLSQIKETREHILNDANKRLEVICTRLIKIINTRIKYFNKFSENEKNNLNKYLFENSDNNTILKQTYISKRINALLNKKSKEKEKDKDKDKEKEFSSNIFKLTYANSGNKKLKQLLIDDDINFSKDDIKSKTQLLNKKMNSNTMKRILLKKDNEKNNNNESRFVNSFKFSKTGFTYSEKNFNINELLENKEETVIKPKNEMYSIKPELRLLHSLKNTLEGELLLSKFKKDINNMSKNESLFLKTDINLRKKAKTLIIRSKPIDDEGFKNEQNNNSRQRKKSSENELKNNLTLNSDIANKKDIKNNDNIFGRVFSEKKNEIIKNNIFKNSFKENKNILNSLINSNNYETQKSLNIFYNDKKNIESYKLKGSSYCITDRDKYKRKIYKLIQRKIKDPHYFSKSFK